jgi:putative Mn2+ efflux pump MntP
VLALLLVAASVGLSNFAAAIAIGVTGVDAGTRLRVGLIFGAFESGMPVLGLLLGEQVAGPLGHAARWVGAGLLIAVGAYALVNAARAGAAERRRRAAPRAGDGVVPGDGAGLGDSAGSGNSASLGDGDGRGEQAAAVTAEPAARPVTSWRLLISAFALSLDNLVVGFALGTYHTSILVGALVIGAVSVTLSLLGLELGARIGKWTGDRGEQLAGLVLISVGIAIASGALT